MARLMDVLAGMISKAFSIMPFGDTQEKLFRFVIVGCVNTAFSYSVYAVGIYLGIVYWLASFIALVMGIVFSFFTQGRLVFRTSVTGRFPLFVAVWLILYFVNVFFVWGIHLIGFNYYIAGLIALVPTVLLSFLLNHRVVFKSPKSSENPERLDR